MKKFILLLTILGLLSYLLLPPEIIASGDESDGQCRECFASTEGGFPYPIMRPSPEELQRWVEAYNNAPRAPSFEANFRGPTFMQSLSLLSHLDYVPTERNQGSNCGNCWVWAGTGIMGIALDVQEDIHDRLSIQYLNSNYNSGTGSWACCGKDLATFADFYTSMGKTIPWSNTNAHWQDGSQDCSSGTSVLAGNIATTPYYAITSVDDQAITTHAIDEATAINNIKNILNQDRAVAFGYFLPTLADWQAFGSFWSGQSETDIWSPDYSSGHTWVDGEGGGHLVLCVGYNDEEGTDNDYWVILNSWGTDGGDRPNGLFRLDMHMDYDCFFYDPYPTTSYYSLYWYALDIAFDMPDVTTVNATDVDFESATLNGNLTDLGGYSSANVSFEWGETSGALDQETPRVTVGSTGTFDAALGSLSPDTTYYYRAKATANPTVYGNELGFTTTSNSLTSIDITPDSPSIALGFDQQFTATGTYADASTANLTTSVTWTSANTTVATVGEYTGLARSQAEGNTVVTATLGAISGNTTLTVGPKVLDLITVVPPNPSIAAGRTLQFTANGTYSDASTANLTASVTWSSANTTVAMIGADTGFVTSYVPGTANITATLGAVSGNATLSVGPPVLDLITVTPPNPSVAAGRTQQFTANGTYSDASSANITAFVAWTSDNTTVAIIGANTGLAASFVPGTANITATSGSISGNATLSVGPPVLDFITVTPVDPSVALGNSLQFTSTGNYSDASTANLTASVAWSSDNTTVATIEAGTGLATGNATGTANIMATLGAISGNTTLTVEGKRTLTMAVSGNGTTVPALGIYPYDWGSVVNIIANPDLGWRFVNWTGDVGTVDNVNSATANITMNGNYSITANFTRPVLTISINGSGSTSPSVGSYTYDMGYTANITATPDSGWKFSGWTGEVGTLADVNAASSNITIDDDYSIVANFSQVNTGGGGGGGGGGARGLTAFSDSINPEGLMVSDVTALSSDVQAYIVLTKGTLCLDSNGAPVYWIYFKVAEDDGNLPAPPDGSVVITPYYEIEPAGTTFDPPVACTFRYKLWGLPDGANPNNLIVMFWDSVNEQWIPLETQVDAESESVTTMLNHLSLYTVMLVPRPAEFELSELSVTPAEIVAGGAASVNALVTNSGESSGSYEVMLKVNGVVQETRELTIEGDASEVVSFELNDLAAGEYIIEVDGIEIVLNVLPEEKPLPAAFKVSSMTVQPKEAAIGDDVIISVIVANTGESAGVCELELSIDAEVIETRDIDLAAGTSEEIVFTVIPETAGKKIVQVNGLLGIMVVAGEVPPAEHRPLPADEVEPTTTEIVDTEPEPAPSAETESTSTMYWIYVVVAVGGFIAGTIGYFMWRRRSG